MDKRSELLEELRKANGRVTEQAQRATDLEKLLNDERAALHTHIVGGELDHLLDQQHVPAPVRPSVIALLTESYGVELVADGNKRKAVAKLKTDSGEKAVSLKEMVDHWSLTPEAKSVRLAPASTGGGATGGSAGGGGAVKQMTLGDFNALSAQGRLEFMRAGGKISEG